ncbi:MAG: RDD family protein [Clostridia bacterium]|nr:RDD family protein [Clostridia bacterium]
MTRTAEELRPAPFFPRAAAFLLDQLILGVILFIPRMVMFANSLRDGGLTRAALFTYTPGQILFWVLTAAYFIALTACTGSTLGKKAMGLTVVNRDGEKPSFLTVLYRETFARYLSSLLCIGYLLCAVDPERGTLHDRICDTMVVYAPKKESRKAQRTAPASAPAAVAPALPDSGDWYAPNR